MQWDIADKMSALDAAAASSVDELTVAMQKSCISGSYGGSRFRLLYGLFIYHARGNTRSAERILACFINKNISTETTFYSIINSGDDKMAKYKYTYNRIFFQKIDTEEKAYLAGFIAADGSIKRKTYEIYIEIKNSDKRHLQKFLNSLESNGKVKGY